MVFSADLFSTTAVRGGLTPDPATGAVLTPIYQSTTYHQQAVGVHKGFTYSRAANPTVSALEAALGALEDTPPAVCFATGMAAISALFLAILKSGDHVVVSDVVYGGTVRLFQQILTNFGVEASFVDTSDPAGSRECHSTEYATRLHRDACQSHAEADRHRGNREGHARSWDKARGRQHVPYASAAAAA